MAQEISRRPHADYEVPKGRDEKYSPLSPQLASETGSLTMTPT